MNLRDLRYLVAVAELQHFGKAALQCHVSQPTLSGQIKKLEETLGVLLFERTNRRVMPTPVGLEIVAAARSMLREADRIALLAASAQNPLAGNFRLGAFPTLATYLFPTLVPKVKTALPQLRLILQEDKTAQLIEALKSGTLDAALLALPVAEEGLEQAALFDDPFLLAVPEGHALAAYKAIHQKVLAHYKLLLLEEGHCLRDQALEVCQRLGAPEEQAFRATSLETLRAMVRAGTGITFMPKIAVREGEEGLCYVPFKEPAPYRRIGLVWRKTSPRLPAIRVLSGLLRSYSDDHQKPEA